MILVTGGTGLVGTHLLYHLVDKGYPVTAIHRGKNKLEGVKRVFSYYNREPEELFNRIRWREADINDLPSLERAFLGVTHVYHCAGLISYDPGKFRQLKKVNIEGTANMVNMCLSKKIKKLCYVSSIAAIGKSTDHSGVTEKNDWNDHGGNVYAITKHMAEMEVWRASMEGLPVIIVNPGVILGPGFWEKGSGLIFRISARGMQFYPPGGTGFITVNDVVRIMEELMVSDLVNERFILIDKNLTYKELLSNIAREFGKPTPKKQLRAWQLQLLCRLDWLRSQVTGKSRILTKKGVAALKTQQVYSNRKLVGTLEFEFELMAESIYFNCNRFKEAYPLLFA